VKTRLASAFGAAVLTAPLLVLAAPAPALAADCNYPPSGSFRLVAFPAYAKVKPGSIIELGGRLSRNGGDCGDRRIGVYFRLKDQKSFFLQSRQGTNDNGGWAYRLAPKRDFRYFANYNSSAFTVGARSSIGLVQVG
jgi:hypothetical protein